MPMTAVPPLPPRSPMGCRTRVEGVRCGHPPAVHEAVGYKGAMRCACGCPWYRASWRELVVDAGYCGVLLLLIFFLGLPAGFALLISTLTALVH